MPPARPRPSSGVGTAVAGTEVVGTTRHTAPWWQWVLAAALILAAAAIPVVRFLIFWPKDQWLVDVEVYREAGVSILIGRPVYAVLTEPPQLLPFTYPPFAAFLAIPLALMPFAVAGWVWTAVQIAATTAIVWYAGNRLIHGGRPDGSTAGARPLVLALLAMPMFWLHPVGDGIRFGQVNAVIVLACLMDLRRPRPRILGSLPPGVLVGLAMAVKLTPGVFVVHYLIGRRWAEARTAIATAALAWLGAFIALPQASLAFWGGALQDPARLGPNMGTSNQSLRGVLMRIGPDGATGVALWLVCVALVGVFGFEVARRAHLAGESVTEVAAIGLLACLLSPVAWIHHLHWMVVVILAVLGARPGLERGRALAAGVLTVWFVCRLPWWGITWLGNGWPNLPGRILQNGHGIGALLALGLLARTLERVNVTAGKVNPGHTLPAGRSTLQARRRKAGA